MREFASCWTRTGDECHRMADRHDAEKAAIPAVATGDAADRIAEAHASYAGHWREQGTYCRSMAAQLDEGATAIEFEKLVVIGTAVILAGQLLFDAVTFAAGGGAKMVADRMVAQTVVQGAWRVLLQRMTLIGAAQGGLVNAAAQGFQIANGDRESFDRESFGIAVLSSAAGAVAGGAVGRRLAPLVGGAGTAVSRPAARVAAYMGGTLFLGGAGGVAGGVAGAAVSIVAAGGEFTREALAEAVIPGLGGGFLGALGAGARGAAAGSVSNGPAPGGAPPAARHLIASPAPHSVRAAAERPVDSALPAAAAAGYGDDAPGVQPHMVPLTVRDTDAPYHAAFRDQQDAALAAVLRNQPQTPNLTGVPGRAGRDAPPAGGDPAPPRAARGEQVTTAARGEQVPAGARSDQPGPRGSVRAGEERMPPPVVSAGAGDRAPVPAVARSVAEPPTAAGSGPLEPSHPVAQAERPGSPASEAGSAPPADSASGPPPVAEGARAPGDGAGLPGDSAPRASATGEGQGGAGDGPGPPPAPGQAGYGDDGPFVRFDIGGPGDRALPADAHTAALARDSLGAMLHDWSSPDYVSEVSAAVGDAVEHGRGTVRITAEITGPPGGERGLTVEVTHTDASTVRTIWQLDQTPRTVERVPRGPESTQQQPHLSARVDGDDRRTAMWGEDGELTEQSYQQEAGRARRFVGEQFGELYEQYPWLADRTYDGKVIVSEIATNAVTYSPDHRMTLDVTASEDGRVRVTVGNALTPGDAAEMARWTPDQVDNQREGGRGTQLAHALSDRCGRVLRFGPDQLTAEHWFEFHQNRSPESETGSEPADSESASNTAKPELAGDTAESEPFIYMSAFADDLRELGFDPDALTADTTVSGQGDSADTGTPADSAESGEDGNRPGSTPWSRGGGEGSSGPDNARGAEPDSPGSDREGGE
ncbi:ATP-binding protein [Nocardia sp. NPDC019395]|uniref:ATP-binding protein n=1 Tax=Nocardia sp. NPDC019395 TaxID=3154686 RepID=UPI0033C70D5C